MTTETSSVCDDRGNNYTIVEAFGHPGRYHVNLNEWDDEQGCYQGALRVLSDVSLDDAGRYVADMTKS